MSGTSLFRLSRIASARSSLSIPLRSTLQPRARQTRRNFTSTASPSAASPTLGVSSSVPASTSHDALAEPVTSIAGGFEFLDSWVPTIHNLADTLHLSGPYAHTLSVVVLAFAVRTIVTLPLTLWQRGKTRKLVNLVLPEWNRLKVQIPIDVRARCRRSGKSYEEFLTEVKKETKDSLAKLISKHNASPLPAFIGPALVHIPVFILLTALLRQSVLDPSTSFASEVLFWWSPPPELAAQFKVSASILADRGLDPELIGRLQGNMGGPTLADRDPTMVGPISFGMLTMANIELNGWSRSNTAKLGTANTAKTADKLLDDVEIGSQRRTRIITNALRVLAIAFIPIAMQAPGVLIVYWLSSSVYTLLQNSIFAVIDRKAQARIVAKQTDP